MLRRVAPLLVLALAWAGLACAPVVRSERLPGLADQRSPLERVAIAPFNPSFGLMRAKNLGDATPATVASMVTRQLTDALTERVSVVPPEELGLALGIEGGTPGTRLSPVEVARRAAEEFGADAVVLGEVSRFVEREGEAAGTMRPASVGFVVTLYAAPGARPLWRARFDETQRALTENIFNAGRYPGAGSRWLSAEEMADWGAREIARALPLAP